MPRYKFSQLVGKTFVIKNSMPYYDIYDVNQFGDKAKPKGYFKKGDSFILDSYLAPREAGPDKNYPTIKYAKRSNYYFTFFRDSGYYGVIHDPNTKQFDIKVLKQEGAKTIEEQKKEQEKENQTPADIAKEAVVSVYGDIKKLVLLGFGVLAIGYLLPKILKK